jgi:Na+-translocating ferredoxin:NAD+ oxidoreductase RNF subunit RnfB
MDFTFVHIAATVVAVGAMAVAFGIILAIAAQKFAVKVDPRITQIAEALPGANCGGCGYPGCSGYAAAIVIGGADINLCAPGGSDTTARIAEVMGVVASAAEPKVAVVMCRGTLGVAGKKFQYDGISDCRAAVLVNAGSKSCRYGCLGLGSCANACPFGAILVPENKIPVVIEEKCVGCGKCIETCPKHIIELVPKSKYVHVVCKNVDKGGKAKKLCKIACIGCNKCEKECKFDAIHVENNLARIDYEKCKNCGKCVVVCPQDALVNLRPIRKKLDHKKEEPKKEEKASTEAA